MAHFYERKHDGGVTARHFVPMSSRPNELRPTRITDVRRWWQKGERVVPSVTTVLNVLDKGALTNWLIDQHLTAAATIPLTDDIEHWIRQVKQAAEMEMEKAPSAGTDMHKVLEAHMNGIEPESASDRALIRLVWREINEHTGTTAQMGWRPERYFVSPMGYGGCADLVGDGWVIDYKTKQTADKFKPGRMAYDDHRMQLAAYREGFGMPNARCANIFICLETGEIDFHEHKPDELAKGWAMFTRALEIWQIRNDYPADLMEAA